MLLCVLYDSESYFSSYLVGSLRFQLTKMNALLLWKAKTKKIQC